MWNRFVLGVAVLVAGLGTGVCRGQEADATKTLTIQWQRLLDAEKTTCDRCAGTEKALDRAVATLERSLGPLGMRVKLEKKSLGPERAKDILDSNQILIAGHPLEEWLGAKVGSSACGSCGSKLGKQVECRTTSVDGQTYEVIPEQLIVKAGLKAAAEMMTGPTNVPCCSPNKPAEKHSG